MNDAFLVFTIAIKMLKVHHHRLRTTKPRRFHVLVKMKTVVIFIQI